MNPPSQRRGYLTPRTIGRAFWIGLAASLAVHAVFLLKGKFPQAQLGVSPPLEARLETDAFKALPPPAPEPEPAKPAEPVKPPAPAPAAKTRAPAPPVPVAEAPPQADPGPAPLALPADLAPAPQPAPPLSSAEAPPPSAQPYAMLVEAAERIRNLPARIEIVYELKGMLSGRQVHTFEHSGQRYTLEAAAEATGLAGLFMSGRLVQKSSGRIGDLGLMPEHYEIQRPTGKNESLTFDYAGNVIESRRTDARRSPRTRELPLLIGVQDPLSSIYQLAMAARDGKDGLLIAASSKKVQGYPYRMLGSETVRTPLGEMQTLHVTRAGDPGQSDTHLWLAPAHHTLPVKIRYVDEGGTEWMMEAISIKAR